MFDGAVPICININVLLRSALSSWLLYEKPGFQGRTIALEEGPTELVNEWVEPEPNQEVGPDGIPVPTKPMVIGSIRLAVRVRASGFGFDMETEHLWFSKSFCCCVIDRYLRNRCPINMFVVL